MSDHAGLEAHYQAIKDQDHKWLRPSIGELINMFGAGFDSWDESAIDNAYWQLYVIARVALDDLEAMRERTDD